MYISLFGSILINGFDDTDGNGLFHVSDGETTKRGVFLEHIDGEGFGGEEGNHSSITSFDEFGFFFKDLVDSSVNLGVDFTEFANNVSSVAIEDWAISVFDLSPGSASVSCS